MYVRVIGPYRITRDMKWSTNCTFNQHTIQLHACYVGCKAAGWLLISVMFLSLPGEGDVRQKTVALKKIIQLMLNGERFPGLLMPIIQYVMPSQDHTLKKLLLIFWEIVPKTTPDGKLLHEMILVCDAYRKVCACVCLHMCMCVCVCV